jgi:hypothetical protein
VTVQTDMKAVRSTKAETLKFMMMFPRETGRRKRYSCYRQLVDLEKRIELIYIRTTLPIARTLLDRLLSRLHW